MKGKINFIFYSLLLGFAPAVSAQQETPEAKPEYTRRYLVLSTRRESTLEKELKDAVAANYHVIMGNAGHKILLLEKKPQDTPKREFVVVENLHRGLKEQAAQGFRLIPATVGMDQSLLGGVVEKSSPTQQTRFEYLILDPVTTSNLQKDVLQTATQGYRPVAFAAEERHAVVVERPERTADIKPESVASGEPYLLLATSRSSTLQSELNAAVSRGYRVLLGAGGNENFLLLEKREVNSPAPEYLVIATTKSETLEKEINEAVGRGFRLLPRTMAAVKKKASFLGTYGYETTVVMEKASDTANPPKYLVIGTRRVDTFRKELAEAEQQNYELLGMMLSYEEQVAILGKAGH